MGGACAEGDYRAAGGGEAGQDDEGAAASGEGLAETFLRGGEAAGAGDRAVQAFAAAPGEPVRHQVAQEGRGRRGRDQRQDAGDLMGHGNRVGRRTGARCRRRRGRDDQHTARQDRQEHIKEYGQGDHGVDPWTAGQRPHTLEQRISP